MNAKQSAKALAGEIVETRDHITLTELCQSCGVQVNWIVELVDEGILEPIGNEESEWRFASVSVVRVRKVHRLQHDLGVNIPGIALALNLLDELDELRQHIRRSPSAIKGKRDV